MLELVLVLGGISALSAGSFVTYKVLNGRAQTNTAVEATRYLSNTLMQTYGQTGSFANLDTQSVINGQLAPSDLPAKGTSLTSPWGGTVTVAPSTTGTNAFSVTFNAIPSSACSNMASRLSRDFATIQINGTQVAGSGQSLDIGNASKICGGSNQNTLVLTSNIVAQPTTGEVQLPADHGAPPPLPVITPPTLGSTGVAPVTALTPQLATLPTNLGKINAPTVSAVTVKGVSSSVSQTSGTAALPPTTALPPQTCFPSTVNTTATSTDYGYQTLSCSAGYTGSISQQEARTASVTTTKVTTCATNWATPSVTTTVAPTVYGAWGAWTTTANTCAAMCSTQMSSYPVQYNYQWVTVNVGCPAGYTGTNSYQAQQVQSRSASCANPSGTAAPVYGGWGGWSNTGATQNAVYTCVQNIPIPDTPNIAFSMYGGMVDISPMANTSYYQIGVSCGIQLSSPVPNANTIQSVANSGLVTSNNGFDTFKPAVVIGAGSGGQAQFIAMQNALPMTSCLLGTFGTWPAQIQVRACSSSGCSAWSAQTTQFCSWGKC